MGLVYSFYADSLLCVLVNGPIISGPLHHFTTCCTLSAGGVPLPFQPFFLEEEIIVQSTRNGRDQSIV